MSTLAHTGKFVSASIAASILLAAGMTSAAAAPKVERQNRMIATTTQLSTTTAPATFPGLMETNKVWGADISTAPLNPNSAAMVSNLTGQVSRYYSGIAAFNNGQNGARTYTAPAGTKRVNFGWNNCQNKPYTPTGLLGDDGQFGQIPVPDNAVPSTASDGGLIIYSPSTNQLWELWKVSKIDGHWKACWGGRIDNVSQSYGYFKGGFGASASGTAVSMGAVTTAEVRAGAIKHAMALAIPDVAHWKNYSWPAQRSDGASTALNAIPEGIRLRLDPSVDVNALNLNPVAKQIAIAAQKYGFIVTDRSGSVAVTGESGAVGLAETGVNPWVSLTAVNGRTTPSYLVMKNFPWHRLQALPMNYGQPAAVTP
jgi:hypothetical protein